MRGPRHHHKPCWLAANQAVLAERAAAAKVQAKAALEPRPEHWAPATNAKAAVEYMRIYPCPSTSAPCSKI
jgi:hypothetical protein